MENHNDTYADYARKRLGRMDDENRALRTVSQDLLASLREVLPYLMVRSETQAAIRARARKAIDSAEATLS